MAKNKHSKSKNRRGVNYSGRAEKIRKFRSLPFKNRTNFTPSQKRTISKLWADYKYLTPRNLRKVGAKTRQKLKAAGYRVEEKGAIIEKVHKPGAAGGKELKGSRLYVRKSGTTTQKIGDRTDFIIPVSGDMRGMLQFDPEYHLQKMAEREKIKTKRKFYHIVVDGRTWGKYKTKGGRLTASGLSKKLRSFRDKNPKAYKKAHIAVKIVTFSKGGKRGKKRR